MSEVEKLMQNANVEKDCKLYGNIRMCPYKTRECTDCKYYVYPEFTAEKQLSLIKWLAKTRQVHITCLLDNWIIEGFVRYEKKYNSFENALAGLINEMWQDLSDTEKAEIKRILE